MDLFWQFNCVLMLNWIVWNRADYLHINGFGVKKLQRLICHKIQPTNQPTNQRYIYSHAHIYIYIIMKSCRQNGFHWFSFATCPYCQSFLASHAVSVQSRYICLRWSTKTGESMCRKWGAWGKFLEKLVLAFLRHV